MITALVFVVWLLVGGLGAVMLYRGVLALAYGFRGRSMAAAPATSQRTFSVVIPAHNEELLIDAVVQSIRAADYAQDRIRITVIADNCTDATAERARAAGAEAAERFDDENRGKGQALDWMFRRLDLEGADAVALFDADNLVEPNFFTRMNAELEAGGRCLQGYYGISNPDDSVFTRMLAVTYEMKNLLYNGGKAALGLSVSLMGTGMVFRREIIEQYGWQADSIAEDLEQTFNLLEHGEAIRFIAGARIRAQESTTLKQGFSQRQRWATGRRALTARARAMIKRGVAARSFELVDAGLDLLMPTYSKTLYLSGLGLLLSLLLFPWNQGLLLGIGVVLAIQVAEIVAAVRIMRAGPRYLLSFGFAPVFLVWKAVVDGLALFGHQRDVWTRTDRLPHVDATEERRETPAE